MPDYPDGMREEVAALVPPSVTRLLDVGCARGGFGQALARRGIEIWGIEIDEAPAAIARQRLASVIVGAYPEAMPEGLTFDCISFIDVLEHMVNPVGALLAAHSHLVDGGYVVASIPNVRHASIIVPLVLKGRWDYQVAGLLDRTHLRWFTKATMRESFAAMRFQHRTPRSNQLHIARRKGPASPVVGSG